MGKIIFGLLLVLFTIGPSTPATAQYTILSQFGNLTDCDTMTRGPFIVWWDNNWNMAADADEMLDSLLAYRDDCINNLGMQDPPNPPAGHYYNVYIHRQNDVFPGGWGNGQGTDQNGFPYLTLPVGAHNDWINVSHEGFHVFQYSATSPGFAYSGDSQWYIEAAANWYTAHRYPTESRAFLEAESLVRLPHVALWLSFDNFPSSYPQNWQRYVHQYAMALFLHYLTESAGESDSLVAYSHYTGTNMNPQQYFFNELGGATFRQHFIEFAAHMTNGFDFVTPGQRAVFENEWNTYADPADDFEFLRTYTNSGSNGWVQPGGDSTTHAWSFNTYKLNNSVSDNYTFHLDGDPVGSSGGSAYFQGMVVVVNSVTGTTFHDLNMVDDWDGTLSLNLTADDEEVYFIIAAMPEVFLNVNQTFSYQMRIDKGAVGVELPPARPAVEVARYNILGQEIGSDFEGVQFILYGDGSVRKVLKRRD